MKSGASKIFSDAPFQNFPIDPINYPAALAVAQQEPWPGQQQLPVTQQLFDLATAAVCAVSEFAFTQQAFFVCRVVFAFAWAQHDPCPGQQQLPVAQQPSLVCETVPATSEDL